MALDYKLSGCTRAFDKYFGKNVTDKMGYTPGAYFVPGPTKDKSGGWRARVNTQYSATRKSTPKKVF
jgi:hypothetical protein